MVCIEALFILIMVVSKRFEFSSMTHARVSPHYDIISFQHCRWHCFVFYIDKGMLIVNRIVR